MANPSGRAGHYYEARLLEKLVEVFPHAHLLGKQGAKDKGDFGAVYPFVIQAKNRKEITLAKFMDDTMVQRHNAKAPWGVCVINRKNALLGRSYVVQEFAPWLDMVQGL